MKTLLFFCLFSSFSTFASVSFLVEPENLVFLTRTHDVGDQPGNETCEKSVVYKSGLLKCGTLFAGKEIPTKEISPGEMEDFLFKNQSNFRELQITEDMGQFPCNGKTTLSSAGLPQTNYSFGLVSSSLVKPLTLPSGQIIKVVTFPEECLSTVTVKKLEVFFEKVVHQFH